MAVLLEHNMSVASVTTDGSVISSPHGSSDMKDCEAQELFHFHLNYDGSLDFGTEEFYNNISSTSTPRAAWSSELQQRSGYDTDDSGFNESLVCDSELLQMSNLHLEDETQYENGTRSRRSDTFPLPKLCLLAQFDETCDDDSVSSSASSHKNGDARKKSELVDLVPSERISVRRQRSPDAVVERCSRYRLSLDSFSESCPDDREPDRRSSDSFVLARSTLDATPSTLEDPSCSILPPPALEESSLSSLPETSEDNSHILSPALVDIPPIKQAHENELTDSSPDTDADEVLRSGLQRILANFAPPCLANLIGRKMGLRYVDIITELSDRSMSLIICHVCSYLTDTDLCSLLLVSMRWSNIIMAERRLMSRVRALKSRNRLVTKVHSKENVMKSSKASTSTGATRSLTTSTAGVQRSLTVIANHSLSRSVSKTSKSVSSVNKTSTSCSRIAAKFWKEAEKLYSGETLMKCPRCGGPSRTDRVQDRGHCALPSCQFDFCLLCLMSFHYAQRCKTTISPPSVSTPDNYIGGRKSRRQLRRLC